jgi:hypothetical protein
LGILAEIRKFTYAFSFARTVPPKFDAPKIENVSTLAMSMEELKAFTQFLMEESSQEIERQISQVHQKQTILN